MVFHYLLLLFDRFANTVGPFRPPQDFNHAESGPPALCVRKVLSGLRYICFLFFLCSDDRAMGFPDSSSLFFDLISFVYLLSESKTSCWGRDLQLVQHQRDLGGWLFPRGSWGFFYAIG